MRKRVSAAIVLTLGGLGIVNCSSTSSQGPAPGTASYPGTGYSPQSPGTGTPTSVNAHLTPSSVNAQTMAKGTRIYGPQIELVRDKKGLRGQGPLGAVELSQTTDGFTGLVGAGTTNIHIEPTQGDNFNLRGSFAAAPANLQVRSDRIQGQIGRCQYDLQAADAKDGGRAYGGARVCGSGSEPTTVTFSPQIAGLEPQDRGALIAIILGR